MNKPSSNLTGILFALIAYGLFVAGDSCYKYLGTSYTIYQMAFYGKLVACLLIISFVIYTRKKVQTKFLKLQIYRGLSLTTTFLCILFAYRHMTLTEVALIFYISPFITCIFTYFLLKEPIGIHRIMIIIGGFIGILIILRPGYVELNPALFILLLGVIAFSYGNILARIIGKDEPDINFTLFPTIISCIIVLPMLLLDPVIPTAIDFSIMGLGGIIGSAAILFISMAYVRTHAVTISILAYTDIIWAMLLGYIIFGDTTTDPYVYLGGLLIMVSGCYLVHRENKLT